MSTKTAAVSSNPDSPDTSGQIPLKEPFIAAALALLIPGLGHWYQGRRAKAVIFFVCITSSFYYGLYLGDGRVVYASWNPTERRLPFICQAFVGASALPAVIQAQRFRPYNTDFSNFDDRVIKAAQLRLGETIPDRSQVDEWTERLAANEGTFWSWYMAPPVMKGTDLGDKPDELDLLNKRLNRFFELGTVYTMIAGLLNVLVIYDAFAGPAFGYCSPRYMLPPSV